MRSEYAHNLLIVLSYRQNSSPSQEIMVAEHDGEGRFIPEADVTLFLRMRTKKAQNTGKTHSDR